MTIESPCVGRCALDERIGLCIGCLRTIEEIVGWREMSASQRRTVLRAVARRLARAGGATKTSS